MTAVQIGGDDKEMTMGWSIPIPGQGVFENTTKFLGEVPGKVGDAAKSAGEAGLNVATLGGYDRDKRLDSQQDEILRNQKELLENRGPAAAEPAPEASAATDQPGPGAAGLDPTKAMGALAQAHGGKAEAHTGALGPHMVAEGDTLSGIAAENGKSLQDLIKANPGIEDPNKISVGQEINLGGDGPGKNVLEQLGAAAGAGAPTPQADSPELSV